ncbi:minor capsid protein [Anaerocolumna sp.]|uniref:minor capsid protein n=1 Tax=Anaerocolumna sp. TaxID=2041569 RepID=UPI0028AE1362|nr:minor capsid protein [Anaerocolumna sp.]
MAKINDEYWQKRFEILQEALLNKGDKYYAELVKQYAKASRNVQDKITLWYMRLADNNEVSLTRAKQMLSNQELKELKWTLEEYIRYGKENAINQQWVKELENASARAHISKLQAIQLEIQQQIEVLAKTQEIKVPELLQEIYTEGYYKTAYETQKGFNTGWDIQKLDTSTIKKVMSKPWTVDNKTFSDRIWSNKEQLIDTLHRELTQSVIRGDAPDKLIKTISDKFDTSRKVAGRLVMTESAAMSSVSRQDCFKDLGVEEYKVVATLDLKTSSVCRSMDGKVFKMSDYKIGVTANPFHPNCRSTTAPYFADLDDILTGQRAARDPVTGKTMYVDDKMTYPEWYEKHVKGNQQAELNEKKLKNAGADQKQFDKYKQRLGAENLPKSLDKFQDIKYTDETEYGILKAQVKGMTYYDKAVLNETDISAQVKKVAETTGMDTMGIEYRIKTKESFLEKVRKNFNPDGNEYEIKDIIRYTLGAGADNLSDKTLKVIDKFEQEGYNTIRIKNTWGPDSSYNGINTFIKAPNGQVFEMQYHTPESFKLKNGELHKLYEKQRKILDDESEEYLGIEDQMIELSSKLAFPKNIERVKNK